MTLIRELIDIPEQVSDGDFVLKLTEGVDKRAAQATADSYEVTDKLVKAFDQALGLIAKSVTDGSSAADYLQGTFGSGKSHFMAMLHLLLQGHPAARAKQKLHKVIADHDAVITGKKFLLVPIHFLDARSMEQKILGGYVERVAQLHPDAPVPAVYLADNVVTTELPGIRRRMGEDTFLAGLNAGTDGGDDWGEFGTVWTTEAVDAALAQPATSDDRRNLVAAYIAAYRQGTQAEALATGQGYIDLSRGLATISAHAKGLGYDAVILFLDELILWLASNIGDLNFVQQEAQKLTNLVEGSAANRPAPIVSFVARQRDLRDLVGDQIVGAERLSFADMLALQSGRFGEIELHADDLPVIAQRRLLKPVSKAAAGQLAGAVEDAVQGRGDVLSVLLGTDADLELFRTVYPFSPTLVRALIDVAEALQRERTALKVMLQLLVDRRDQLELGQIIPVGDLWDVVAARDEPFAREMRTLFDTAKRLYRTRLRPMLLAENALTDDIDPADPRWNGFRTDDRLVKTLLLAALVPEVEAFRHLDANRLAALNWGTITSPIPGREAQLAATKLRKWSGLVGELKVSDDPVNPQVGLLLVNVDSEAVVAAAAEDYDNLGARRRSLRKLIDDALGNKLGDDLTGTYKLEWRGTDRFVDTTFGNVRDAGDVPDAALRASGGRPKIVIDFPFDEAGRTPEEDLERLDIWQGMNDPTLTICWLPSFLNREGLSGLGRYVAIDELLKSDRFDQHTQHLSQRQRLDLKPVLTSMRDQLRSQLREAVLVAYGVLSGDHPWVDAATALTDHFRSLEPSLVARPTTAPTLAGALDQLCDQLLAHQYPGHPRFDARVTGGMIKTTWEEMQRALADPDRRVNIESTRRSAVRTVAPPLGLGTMGESHFVLGSDWVNRLDRYLAEAKAADRTVTVGDVRAWIDAADGGPRGLPHEIADLVVLAVAAECDHSLTHGGVPALLTPGRALSPDVVLRPEQLPPADDWRLAVAAAGYLLGVPAGAHVTGPEVGAFGDRVSKAAGDRLPAQEGLVAELDRAYRRRGLSAGDRRASAIGWVELLRKLKGASADTVVEVLAHFTPPTSLEAFAESMTAEPTVAQSLRDTNWALLEAAGPTVTGVIDAALTADELVTNWDRCRRDMEEQATKILAGDAPTPPPRPPVGGGRKRVQDTAGLEAVIGEVAAYLEETGEVEVTWGRPSGDGAAPA